MFANYNPLTVVSEGKIGVAEFLDYHAKSWTSWRFSPDRNTSLRCCSSWTWLYSSELGKKHSSHLSFF